MNGDISSGRLHAACAQFEAAMLRSMWAAGGLRGMKPPNDDDHDANSNPAATNDLIAEAFAQALERAGGIGVGARLARILEERP